MNEEGHISDQLRWALRRLAKAVVVITSAHEGRRYAMAATAVSELSLNPPSLLVCVNREASLFSPLAAGANFCVNILHSSQLPVARACGGSVRGEERFDFGNWDMSASGVPCLGDAQASVSCSNDLRVDYGTHAIFIGRVSEVRVAGTVDPLLYADGKYCRVGTEQVHARG